MRYSQDKEKSAELLRLVLPLMAQQSAGSVTLSMAVAIANPGETLEHLIHRADEAMYAAKRGGRNRVCQAR